MSGLIKQILQFLQTFPLNPHYLFLELYGVQAGTNLCLQKKYCLDVSNFFILIFKKIIYLGIWFIV